MPLRTLNVVPAALMLLASAMLTPHPALSAQRHCQTVLTCNFKKGGIYRGCLSSYSCRQCRFVSARCGIGKSRGNCQKIVCDWGG
jgi:hypothetical protein